MVRWARIGWLTACLVVWPTGCTQDRVHNPISGGAPAVRVLVFENQEQVSISASAPPTVRVGGQPSGSRLNLPGPSAVPIVLTGSGWQIGGAGIGRGEMLVDPSSDGTVRIDGRAYHGRYRFVPTAPTRFDVVNELDLESYLKGVLRSELFPAWHEEAYKAQAIVARTYALYEAKTAGAVRHFDLYADQRSQVYGGISAESAKSRDATDATAGIVVASGPFGRETIFKTYFSACCGGISQSASDAFADAPSEPLSDQDRGSCCAQSPKFNWAPISIPKAEITRRIRAWGNWKKQPQKDIGAVVRIEIEQTNRFGRPIRFFVFDARGYRYSMRAEDFREAVNTDAGVGPKIFSSFCRPVDDGPSVRFTQGHGYGHGVGMCQWCAESQAARGWNDEAIVLSAFPGAKLVRAY